MTGLRGSGSERFRGHSSPATSSCAATRFLRFLAASIVLAGFAFAVPAYAQTTLVSNQGETTSTTNASMESSISIAAAQGFTTGSATATLTEVVVDIRAFDDPQTPYGTPDFAVYGSTSDGKVDTTNKLGDLSGGTVTGAGRYSITSPGIQLEANTQYFVVLAVNNATLQFFRTDSTNQTSSHGWTIRDDAASVLLPGGTFFNQSIGGPIKIEIKGTAGDNTNNAPTVANAIPDQGATAGTPFSYTFPANTFADQDNDTLSYTASGMPSWLSFNANTRTFSGVPQAADTGTASVSVSASDGNGGSVSDTFVITVSNTNNAPTVANAIPDQGATAGTAFSYTFPANTFADQDNDTLSYTASGMPSWLSFNANTRTFSGTPQAADVGTASVSVSAGDGNGGSVSDTFVITVSNPNNAPTVANAIPDQNATAGTPFSYTFRRTPSRIRTTTPSVTR